MLWNVPQSVSGAACAMDGDGRRRRLIANSAWTGRPHASFETAPLYRDCTAIEAMRAYAIRRGSFGRKRARAWRVQLGKQASCRHEAARLESLGKPLIDGGEHIVRLPAAIATLP